MPASPDDASALVATAELCPLDELDRARLVRLRAQIAFARRRGSDAPPLLFEAARRLEPLDAALARETHLDALGAAIFAGRLANGPSVAEMAEAARCRAAGAAAAAGRRPAPRRPGVPVHRGLRRRRSLRSAALCDVQCRVEAGATRLRWLWLACRIASELWDDETWEQLAIRQVGSPASAAPLAFLPLALTYRAGTFVHAGEFAAAAVADRGSGRAHDIDRRARRSCTPSSCSPAWRGEKTTALAADRRRSPATRPAGARAGR